MIALPMTDASGNMKKLEKRLQKLESHIEKLHDLVNMEDRITACDVLNRLTLLEEQLSAYEDLLQHAQEGIEKCFERIEELEEKNHFLKKQIGKLQEEGESKRPYKCPVCTGSGLRACDEDEEFHYICEPCKSTGIIWG